MALLQSFLPPERPKADYPFHYGPHAKLTRASANAGAQAFAKKRLMDSNVHSVDVHDDPSLQCVTVTVHKMF